MPTARGSSLHTSIHILGDDSILLNIFHFYRLAIFDEDEDCDLIRGGRGWDAAFEFFMDDVYVTLYLGEESAVSLRVQCWDLDWQVMPGIIYGSIVNC